MSYVYGHPSNIRGQRYSEQKPEEECSPGNGRNPDFDNFQKKEREFARDFGDKVDSKLSTQDQLCDLIGVGRSADFKEIKVAVRTARIRFHPDKNPEEVEKYTEIFKRLTALWETYQKAQDKK